MYSNGEEGSVCNAAATRGKSAVLHNVVKLQHGVRRRVDEDVGQRVLVVVHLIWNEKKTRDLQRCP